MAKKKATKKKVTKKATKKAAAKKTTAKKSTKVVAKTTQKKSTAKKAAKQASSAVVASNKPFDKVAKARTKSQILLAISERTGLSKRDIGGVFDTLSELIGNDLRKGPGSFTVPGLMKVVVVRKPAVKARKGVNPFTGEEMTFKAKPARNVVKVRPLKGLKDKV